LGVEDASSFVLKNASNLSDDLVDSGDLGQEDQEDLLVPIKNFKKVQVKSNRVSGFCQRNDEVGK
jgi:polyhydroxyalkanoate synthesis regulator phasin